MSTFHRNGVTVHFEPSESMETILAIADEADRLNALHWRQTYLRSIKHGHRFEEGYKCRCGPGGGGLPLAMWS